MRDYYLPDIRTALEVFLIRHTTPAVSKGMIYGRTDVGLAETFLAEKDTIISKLSSEIEALYSSPSTRCTQLASYISKNYITDERLYEVNFGQWEGKTWDTVDQETLDPWMQDFVNVCPPAGESMIQMQDRVMHFWKELLQCSYAKAALVTHGGVIRIILATIQGIPLKDAFDIKVELSDVILVRPKLSGQMGGIVTLL